MIECHICKHSATVHVTNITANGQKNVMHLCDTCAESQHILQNHELSMPAILEAIIDNNNLLDIPSQIDSCPNCGIHYQEFRAKGRLGCHMDYEVFRSQLEPLMQSIHYQERHCGKVPSHAYDKKTHQQELHTLREQLQIAILNEDYEQAATLRDLIREKELRA